VPSDQNAPYVMLTLVAEGFSSAATIERDDSEPVLRH
jgi:hypothetical protein